MDVDSDTIPSEADVTETSRTPSLLPLDLPSAETLLADIKEQMETNRVHMATIDRHIGNQELTHAKMTAKGINDPIVTSALANLKERRADLTKVANSLAISFNNLATSSVPSPLHIASGPSDTESDIGSLNTTSTSPSFYKKLPVKIQSHWPTYKGAGGMHAYNFIDIFTTRLRLELGDEIFLEHGPTYLILLTTNTTFQDRLRTAFSKLEDKPVSLDQMEQTFID
ncbi:hypothetical protein BGX29_005102, partial [Mortierella sp. GBA35]